MLRLLIGPASSGKSKYIRHELAALGQERQALLIVPEQASFANEKKLFCLSSNVEVTSFRRLCELILRQTGQGEAADLTEAAAVMMMSVALEEISDQLQVYFRNYQSRGFVEQLVLLAKECRNAAITPETLSAFSFGCQEGALREKSYELSLILDTYNAVLRQSFVDENDKLNLCAGRLLEKREELRTLRVYIDDFASFTAPQRKVIEVLIGYADSVTVSVCSDDKQSGSPAFLLANKTVSELLRCAETAQSELLIEEFSRKSVTLALDAIEQAARSHRIPVKQAGEGVACFAAANLHEELCFVAANIRRLVAGGMRYREIAVIARDLGNYQALLPSVFARYDIPYFLDAPQDARSKALYNTLLTVVQVAAGVGGDLCDLAKASLLGIDPQQAGELENYCYIWSLPLSCQLSPFVNHPDGIQQSMSELDKERLRALEQLRLNLAEPILALREQLRLQTGEGFARGVYDFLQKLRIQERLSQLADRMPPLQRQEFFEQQSLLWSGLCDILDLFYRLPLSIRLTPQRMVQLFELSLGSVDVATIPRSLDEVAVGTADRMRPESPKAVFLLGAAEGKFPKTPEQNPLFPEADRKLLREQGIPFADAGDWECQEHMLCYRAMTAPSERLFVSYSRLTGEGEQQTPSSLYTFALPLCEQPPHDPYWKIQTKESAKFALAERMFSQGEEFATIKQLCERHCTEQELGVILTAPQKPRHRLSDRLLAKQLFGGRLRLSPSRLEQYYCCPFSYFVASGLKVQPRQKAELSSLQAGTLLHFVLEKAISRHGMKALEALGANELRELALSLTQEYLAERVGDQSALPKRVQAGFERISEWIFELLQQLVAQFAQSKFEPVAFELKIAELGEIKPLLLHTPDGTTISVEGSVDRVDRAEINGKSYIRVVDYKSGQRSFLLSDVFYGLNMQMLVYLFSIWQNGRDEWENVLPAGILYQTALGKYHSADRAEGEAELAKRKQKHYQLDGLLLDDEQVLRAMELDGAGVFIPSTKADSLVSLAEMGRLKQLIERKITDMAELLQDGRIQAVPTVGKTSPCDFCAYRGICRFEQGDETIAVLKIDNREILAEEGNNHG